MNINKGAPPSEQDVLRILHRNSIPSIIHDHIKGPLLSLQRRWLIFNCAAIGAQVVLGASLYTTYGQISIATKLLKLHIFIPKLSIPKWPTKTKTY